SPGPEEFGTSRGLPTEEEREAATQQARGRRGRRRARHSEDDAVDPLDVDFGLGRERLVRRRLPEFPAVPHVALLPGTQALDYGRGLPNHLADDRSTVPDLLHLVHREQQESPEEARRDEERREEENLVIRRDDEPRRSQRCEERGCQDDRD